MKRLFILLIVLLSCHIKSYPQGTVEFSDYVFEAAYDKNGDYLEKETKKGGLKILVGVTMGWGFGDIAQCGYYSPITGLYDNSTTVIYNYTGSNNGWMIFRCDLGYLGTNFLYVYYDYSKIRTAMAYDHGKFQQYRKFIKGEDINTTPTK